MLQSLMKDKVILEKKNGTVIENIKALVQSNLIFITDSL